MSPSIHSTTNIVITPSSLEAGHTNVTITFSFNLINLMQNQSKIVLKFNSTLFPFWKMLDSISCEIPKPANFIGHCRLQENTIEIVVNKEYDFGTDYTILVHGISQAAEKITPTFEI